MQSTVQQHDPPRPLHLRGIVQGVGFRPFVFNLAQCNLREEPIVTRNGEAAEHLAGIADWFLTHDRDIFMRADDSVVRTFAGATRVLRRSRGYAPRTVDIDREMPELLAVGGGLKNAFCLTKGRHAILSQHIGDRENYATLVFFEEALASLKKVFRVEPKAVAQDAAGHFGGFGNGVVEACGNSWGLLARSDGAGDPVHGGAEIDFAALGGLRHREIVGLGARSNRPRPRLPERR